MNKVNIKKHAATWLVVLLAVLAGYFIWQHYFNSLWTRDARVVARVIQMAPDVAGRVTAMPLQEGQSVKKGQLLFSIDKTRYQLAVTRAEAVLAKWQSQLVLRQNESRRAVQLGHSISHQELEQKQAAASAAEAAVAAAKAELAVAQLNLKRTRVTAPFDVNVTRLGGYVGDYVDAGEPLVALVKTDSYWLQAYFKETQVHRLAVGDKVEVHLLGVSQRLNGRVRSIGRGIANNNQLPGDLGLPSVAANFDWVRLAQRIPVEISFENKPDDLLLSAGMTASVTLLPATH